MSRIRPGVLFVPFHYGYWDASGDEHDRAANELTITDWDPASKQPIFKTAAAAVTRLGAGEGPAAAPTTTASAPAVTRLPVASTVGGRTAMVTEQVTAFTEGTR